MSFFRKNNVVLIGLIAAFSSMNNAAEIAIDINPRDDIGVLSLSENILGLGSELFKTEYVLPEFVTHYLRNYEAPDVINKTLQEYFSDKAIRQAFYQMYSIPESVLNNKKFLTSKGFRFIGNKSTIFRHENPHLQGYVFKLPTTRFFHHELDNVGRIPHKERLKIVARYLKIDIALPEQWVCSIPENSQFPLPKKIVVEKELTHRTTDMLTGQQRADIKRLNRVIFLDEEGEGNIRGGQDCMLTIYDTEADAFEAMQEVFWLGVTEEKLIREIEHKLAATRPAPAVAVEAKDQIPVVHPKKRNLKACICCSIVSLLGIGGLLGGIFGSR
ncbi:MAG TPA: hypothetical protein VFF04_01670 [Candidatus Babeliales bacterium]|nr:hypothetical protein [Candidatus Babeliales bacterium]